MAIHNIEYEKELIEALGYGLIGPDNSNRWIIVDDNDNQVGFIQYKKIHSKNIKKGLPKTFGYHIEIDSKDVTYNGTRKLNSNVNKTIDRDIGYVFDIKRENGDIDSVEINLTDYPSLNIWSKTFGHVAFKVGYDGMFLNFKSKTENFNIEELVIFRNENKKVSNILKEYVYQLKYCDKSIKLSDDNKQGISVCEISGKASSYQQDIGEISISESYWVNGELKRSEENTVDGTVEEMAIKHKMGIDSFNHFRVLINKILPFKKDVISLMLNEDIIKRNGLEIFVPELEKEKSAVLVKKNPNKYGE